MLLDGLNDDLKIANEQCDWTPGLPVGTAGSKHPPGRGQPDVPGPHRRRPDVKDSAGNNWTGAFIDANGDPTVDLRNNLAAESRAKIVYEYLNSSLTTRASRTR